MYNVMAQVYYVVYVKIVYEDCLWWLNNDCDTDIILKHHFYLIFIARYRMFLLSVWGYSASNVGLKFLT